MAEIDYTIAKLENEIKELKVANKKIREKADEVFRNTMWVVMEFGKALQERADLRREVKTLKGE